MHNIRRISLCLPKKLWILYNLGKNVLKTQSEVICGKYQKSRALDKKGGNCLQFPRKLMLELSQRCTSPLMFYLGMFQNFLSCFVHIILQGITVFRNQTEISLITEMSVFLPNFQWIMVREQVTQTAVVRIVSVMYRL